MLKAVVSQRTVLVAHAGWVSGAAGQDEADEQEIRVANRPLVVQLHAGRVYDAEEQQGSDIAHWRGRLTLFLIVRHICFVSAV
jgi:hypothetical protein